ncbi:hypothetical protein ACA910_000730 [Epithemia clementina (nom. ined.)]
MSLPTTSTKRTQAKEQSSSSSHQKKEGTTSSVVSTTNPESVLAHARELLLNPTLQGRPLEQVLRALQRKKLYVPYSKLGSKQQPQETCTDNAVQRIQGQILLRVVLLEQYGSDEYARVLSRPELASKKKNNNKTKSAIRKLPSQKSTATKKTNAAKDGNDNDSSLFGWRQNITMLVSLASFWLPPGTDMAEFVVTTLHMMMLQPPNNKSPEQSAQSLRRVVDEWVHQLLDFMEIRRPTTQEEEEQQQEAAANIHHNNTVRRASVKGKRTLATAPSQSKKRSLLLSSSSASSKKRPSLLSSSFNNQRSAILLQSRYHSQRSNFMVPLSSIQISSYLDQQQKENRVNKKPAEKNNYYKPQPERLGSSQPKPSSHHSPAMANNHKSPMAPNRSSKMVVQETPSPAACSKQVVPETPDDDDDDELPVHAKKRRILWTSAA